MLGVWVRGSCDVGLCLDVSVSVSLIRIGGKYICFTRRFYLLSRSALFE